MLVLGSSSIEDQAALLPEACLHDLNSSVYTQCLTRIRTRVNLTRIHINAHWKLDYVTHLRIWVEPGLNLD